MTADAVEHPLPGGNDTAGVVRIGDTVRPPRRPNSNFVAVLLHQLVDVGFAAAPRHLGTDEQGRQVFDDLPGRTTDHPSQRSPDAYATIGSMLAELHRLAAGTALAGINHA